MMGRKDYQALARAIYDGTTTFHGEMAGQAALRIKRDIRDRIADVLAADSPRFDRARFIEACETGSCKGMQKREVA